MQSSVGQRVSFCIDLARHYTDHELDHHPGFRRLERALDDASHNIGCGRVSYLNGGNGTVAFHIDSRLVRRVTRWFEYNRHEVKRLDWLWVQMLPYQPKGHTRVIKHPKLRRVKEAVREYTPIGTLSRRPRRRSL